MAIAPGGAGPVSRARVVFLFNRELAVGRVDEVNAPELGRLDLLYTVVIYCSPDRVN